MYLVGANVILEIILRQQRVPKCKMFLQENLGLLFISDFALYTIGVILFRNGKENGFQDFVAEGLGNMDILSLPRSSYSELKALRDKWGLNFDGAYQSAVAREFGLQIVTMDKHFEAVAKDIEVHFL